MSKSVVDILELLESTPGSLDKREILEQHRGNIKLKRMFVAATDPYVTYGVAKFKMPPSIPTSRGSDQVIALFLDKILPQLSRRDVTGNAAKDLVTNTFSIMTAAEQKWCLRVLLRNIRCGVDTTVNKVWPGAVPTFSVQLAETLETEHNDDGIVIVEDVSYPVRVEPKLDGLRMIAIKRDGVVTLHTRNGNVLETLPRIQKALEQAKYDNIVLDGEAMAADAGEEAWNESAKVIMSHKKNKDDSAIQYNVFDIMPLQAWIDGKDAKDREPLSTRLVWLEDFFKLLPAKSPVVRVRGALVNSEEELMKFYEASLDDDFEGIMLKDISMPYAFKRSKAIKKMKPIATYEGAIVGHYTGHRGAKREGLWSGFDIVLPNGVVTRVGGGFNDELKASIQLEGPDNFIGRIVEVEGQPPLTKDGKVRFPVFTRFRDARDVDPKVIAAYEAYEK